MIFRDYWRPRSRFSFSFPRRRGGQRTEDTFGLLDTVSIEVRRKTGPKNEHSQSYRCKDPIISLGTDWHRTKGLLESKTLGEIPAYFDIRTTFEFTHVTIDFKLTCLDDIPDVEMVKAWCWVNADGCIISDKHGSKFYSLRPASSVWGKVYEGVLDTVKFTNKKGGFLLWSRESNIFHCDRVWKHEAHAEYVTMWTHQPEGFTLKKGTVYECTWKLRYEKV